jgi:hypothetical protein
MRSNVGADPAITWWEGLYEKVGSCMRDLDHAALLLGLVADEHRALDAMVDPIIFNDAIFGFHAHQAAENALKAWLSGLGVDYPRTHDLRRLLALVEAAGAGTSAYDELVELNPFAVQFRCSTRCVSSSALRARRRNRHAVPFSERPDLETPLLAATEPP